MSRAYGKWKVIRSLSQGSQGHAFLVSLGGKDDADVYVLKRLIDTARIKRFEGEVRACLSLTHPGILRIKDYDLSGDRPYLVSEYHSVGALSQFPITTIPVIDRLRMFSAICAAVGSAHAATPAIIHRDLKPSNIFLKDDFSPVVGDFGICFIDDDGERLTLVDEAQGARHYTAPKLEDGKIDQIRPASDVYSLGKILYWMLAGRSFGREQHRDVRFDLLKDAADPAIHFIYDVLDRTIVLDPSTRIQTANGLAKVIDEIVEKIVMEAHPLDLNAPQRCLYCGAGQYKKRVETSVNDGNAQDALNSTGFGLRSVQNWLVLICDNCGNSQVFLRNFPSIDKWKT